MSNRDFVKQIAAYVPSVLVPGVINFLALGIYTRLLSTEEYGNYIFLLVLITNFKTIGYEWIKLGIFRFYHRESERRNLPQFLTTTGVVVGIVSGLIACGWVISLLYIDGGDFGRLAVAGLLFLFGYSFFDIILQLNRAAIQSLRFGVLSATRAIACLGLAVTLIVFAARDAFGLVLGMVIGTWIAVAVDLPRWAGKRRAGRFAKPLAMELLRYGIPLALVATVGLVIATSDRFIIRFFLNSQELGVYAAGCDLADQSITLVFMVLNLAIYPLILKAAEQTDKGPFFQQMSDYSIYLLGVTTPIAGLIAVCAAGFANVVLGEGFREPAAAVIPWIVLATYLRGIKAYYFDLVFQIGLRTDLQLLCSLPAAAANVALNLALIARFGIMGAAYAAVLSQAIALVISAWVGRRVMRLRLPARDCFKILLAGGLMILAIAWVPGGSHLGGLVFKFALGSVIYLGMAWGLRVGLLRNVLQNLYPGR
ncbi:MAG: lipopolysaccharide biosynthesis protein [Desulfobacterales bacterium]|jgi:O-antigen/teichoic acid export membrane protein|nr:lipopolysaccharide biosynthesis protein [Desulfobacterales bacterium]